MLPVPPLPQIGLPLPHIGLPPPSSTPDSLSRQAGRLQGPDRRSRIVHRRGSGAVLPVLVAPIYLIAPPTVATTTEATDDGRTLQQMRDVTPESGTLRLELEPAIESQLYVDGYYVGITDGNDDVDLAAGAHRVELRADGYEPVAFDVRLSSQRPVTYRARLAVARSAEQPMPPPTSGPMTLYVIPGCYAGNVPPAAVTLPAGCDATRLTTLPR
jgi:hypothetical protein